MATSPPGIPPEIQELVRSEGKKLAARLTQDMKRRERRLVADMKKREKGIMQKVLSALSSSGERGELSFSRSRNFIYYGTSMYVHTAFHNKIGTSVQMRTLYAGKKNRTNRIAYLTNQSQYI